MRCHSGAAGAFSPVAFCAFQFPPEVFDRGFMIAQLEVLNLVQAVSLFRPNPCNYDMKVNTDNLPSQQDLSSGKGRDTILCAYARQLWLISQFVLADALSRSISSHALKRKASELCSELNLSDSLAFSQDILDFNV